MILKTVQKDSSSEGEGINMFNCRKMVALATGLVLAITLPLTALAETQTDANGRTVEITKGETEFTESRTIYALESVQPDMSLRPATNPWVNTTTHLFGVGLNGVSADDSPYVEDEDYPYTLVGNGLASRITVQFDNPIPRMNGLTYDLPGQYKLKDQDGKAYYTYCVDVATEAFSSNDQDDSDKAVYNGKNLEDATYYSSDDASHIRYICLNGYWGATSGLGSMDTFKSLLVSNNVLTQDEADALTPGEAITATQAAVWHFGNSSSDFAVDTDVTGPALKTYSFRSADFEWLEAYKQSGNTIKKVFDFLIQGTVASTADTTVFTKTNALTEFSIDVKDRVSTGEETDSDVYKVDLTFTIGAEILDSDNLTVTIEQDGNTVATVQLEAGKTTYTVSDLELKENSDITLSMSGTHEQGTGVYLFEAKSATASQTLVGVASGTQTVGLKRSIKFNVTEPETVDIPVTKTWDDSDDQDGKRPASVTVHLLADGTDTGKTLVLNVDNGWSGSFTGLQKSANGTDITYTISEDAVTDYTTSIEGYDITNIHTPETTKVDVTKVWSDNNNKANKRPKAVTVRLLANGEETGSKVLLNADNNWRASFTDLPKYANGKLITYTIAENTVTAYTAKISETSTGVFTVTNAYSPSRLPKTDDPFANAPVALLVVAGAAALAAGVVFLRKGNKAK